jgi:RNA polymerase sigma factor (sigma-70 family)
MKRYDSRAITEIVDREQSRLRRFIQSRVRDLQDAEDILQDVFCEFVIASQMAPPIRNTTAWLVSVARNRIIDMFRKQKPFVPPSDPDEDVFRLNELLPAQSAGPDAAYARNLLLAEFESALAELAPEQRDVFIAHEFEGRSFREMAEQTGISINTLLARKRYAVHHLRRRLQEFYSN